MFLEQGIEEEIYIYIYIYIYVTYFKYISCHNFEEGVCTQIDICSQISLYENWTSVLYCTGFLRMCKSFSSLKCSIQNKHFAKMHDTCTQINLYENWTNILDL